MLAQLSHKHHERELRLSGGKLTACCGKRTHPLWPARSLVVRWARAKLIQKFRGSVTSFASSARTFRGVNTLSLRTRTNRTGPAAETRERIMRKRTITVGILSFAAGSALVNCSSYEDGDSEALGEVEVALTNAPSDVSCLVVEVAGKRTDERAFEVTLGKKQVFQMSGLPVGRVKVSADAYGVKCAELSEKVAPTWHSEAVSARISADRVTKVSLSMVHNGQAQVAIDFYEGHGSTPSDRPPLTDGVFSSEKPYMVPMAEGARVQAILTAGDAVGMKADGSPYRLVGIVDGTGAFDNGDGTFTWLVNHELGNSNGIERAHGGKGSFVSKWTVRKADLAVLKGEDLIKRVQLWNSKSTSYEEVSSANFGRFCSADLPEESALYDVESGLGYDGRIFFNGEETGNEGRAMAHVLDGTSYELPRLGKASWENIVPNPKPGVSTVVIGLDDSGGGQLYIYAGTKTKEGSPVERAGLTNGTLYGLKVVDQAVENPAAGIPTTAFVAYEFGNVENWTGSKLETESNTNLVTKFQRPEDGAWDPTNPNHFYFVTTASFSGLSRLWRLAFVDSSRPELGGTIEMLLDGTEGGKMFDNIAVSSLGYVYLQEDVGNNAHLGKVWRYDVASDTLTEVLRADAQLFTPGGSGFLTQDEESTGIIDASHLFGPGWFLSALQAHHSADTEVVAGGQLFAFFDPAAAE